MNKLTEMEFPILKSGLLKDLGLLFLLFAINPVFIFFSMSFGSADPDSILYSYLADTILANGMLFVPGWGHIDTAIILPPLYPLLVAVFSAMHPGDNFAAAEYISSISVLLTLVPFYYIVSRFGSRVFAALAVVFFQFNYYYVFFGFSSLTEGLFFLTVFLALGLAVKFLFFSKPDNWQGLFLVGIATALVFLTRQIGLVLFIFLAGWLGLELIMDYQSRRKADFRKLAGFVCGFLLLIGPYSIMLYQQTGHSLLTQSYRQGVYAVQVQDPAMAQTIDRFREIPENDYRTILVKRRQLFALLPDATEMAEYVYTDNPEPSGGILTDVSDIVGIMGSGFSGLGGILVTNVVSVFSPLGGMLTFLAIISLGTLLALRAGMEMRKRLFIPGFFLTYLLFCSLFGGTIDRYVIVMIPLVLVFIGTEMNLLLMVLKDRLASRNLFLGVSASAAIVLFGFFLVSPMRTSSEIRFPFPNKIPMGEFDLAYITRQEPIFAREPHDPYRFGGVYRTLPNDSLEKIARYGELTGVRYLVVNKEVPNIELYDKATWLQAPGPIDSDYLELKLQFQSWQLYEILPGGKQGVQGPG